MIENSESVHDSPRYQSVATVEPSAPPAAGSTASLSRTSSTRRFAPDSMIAAAAGLVVLAIGLIAITRAGFEGAMNDPVVQVLGFGHTTTLGLIEIAAGLCLLIAGASGSRSGAVFFGAALAIAAFVGAVQTDSFVDSLALESNFAWLLVIAGAVVALSALLVPRYAMSSTKVRPL